MTHRIIDYNLPLVLFIFLGSFRRIPQSPRVTICQALVSIAGEGHADAEGSVDSGGTCAKLLTIVKTIEIAASI